MVHRPSLVSIVGFAVAVAAVPAVVGPLAELAAVDPPGRDVAPAATDRLVGLWSANAAGGAGAPVRFYYFHGDGHGLLRYGRVGLTNTNSFDYEIDGDLVTIVFRKTGERHRVPFHIEAGAAPVLVFDGDPKYGGTTRYVQVRPEPVEPHATCDGAPVAGRLWMDRTAFATGGYGFGLYQLRCAGIDGRGTGWFHRGDFDDWTTESLVYRLVGDGIELEFASGHGVEKSALRVDGVEPRTLSLAEDPRDFWHPHRYVDVGPSFGALDPGAPMTWALTDGAR